MNVNKTAKVFTSGMSQAVRLPKEFRFDTEEVFITKKNGKVILTPKPKMSWQEFFTATPKCEDFVLARTDNSTPQARDL